MAPETPTVAPDLLRPVTPASPDKEHSSCESTAMCNAAITITPPAPPALQSDSEPSELDDSLGEAGSARGWGVEEPKEPDVDEPTVSATSESTSSDSASPKESSSSEGSESDWSAGWAGGVLVVAALHLAVDSLDECSLSGDAQVTGLNKSGAPVGVSGAIAVFLAGGGDNR